MMSGEKQPSLLHHGGGVRSAAKRYGIAHEHWLDLSTGINPRGWPVPPISAAAWLRLPEDDDGLLAAARQYYQAEHILAVAGSQAAIQALPRLRSASRVMLLHPSYAEHAHAWKNHGHQVHSVNAAEVDAAVANADVVVLCNPNNPSGQRWSSAQLLTWHAQLQGRGGWLVVDEAFIDVTPKHSLCASAHLPGLIVLRSLGKFFGLAGARVGFVVADVALLTALQQLLGPWCVTGPAREVARAALLDHGWQQHTRHELIAAGMRLRDLLIRHALMPQGECSLFQWVPLETAENTHQALAQQAILTRLFASPASLRFGLPASEQDWQRLEQALTELS